MAPNAPPTSAINNSDHAHEVFGTLESFLRLYGGAEYTLYRRNNAAPHLSYEGWASSEHVLGPFLYHLTLEAWDDATSSDEKPEEAAKPTSPGLSEREPTVTTNGNGMQHIADSLAPIQTPNESEHVPSTKKRQRRKKKFLSEEIVASDLEDSDNLVELAPAVILTTPSAAPPATNGRRTSLVQRHKKTPLSAPKLPPEDIEESTPSTKLPSKIVKLQIASLKRPTNVLMPEANPLSDDEEQHTPATGVITPAACFATPESASTSSTRRGLRTRTPAQQRPYFHHAKLFEEAQVDPEDGDLLNTPHKRSSTKLAQVGYPDDDGDVDTTMQDEDLYKRTEPPVSSSKKAKAKPKLREFVSNEEDDLETNGPVPVSSGKKAKAKTKRRSKKFDVEGDDVTMPLDDSDVNENIRAVKEEYTEAPASSTKKPKAPPVQKFKPWGRKKAAAAAAAAIAKQDSYIPPASIQDVPPRDPAPKRKGRSKMPVRLSDALVQESASEGEDSTVAAFAAVTKELGEEEEGEEEEEEEEEEEAKKEEHKAMAATTPLQNIRKRRFKPKKSASIVVSDDEDDEDDEEDTTMTPVGVDRDVALSASPLTDVDSVGLPAKDLGAMSPITKEGKLKGESNGDEGESVTTVE
ncbi:hypothetical protein K504DRAFT_539532 [Pleomassaria siparia CBS 279.74]|uniref:Uncharacterized protein n=1 Tax=Pleomassaria siparia CBS 279.74 TaxID=1314801 RepID=A0A6G1JQ27_9PLEO|nr:hypothetical protein K504DRAFT_539532 [Pleomassaria siparia CBS 279.74]